MKNYRVVVLVGLLLSLCAYGTEQTASGIQLGGSFKGNTYENSHLGLSYSCPDKLQAQSLATLPGPSDGRPHILWRCGIRQSRPLLLAL